MAVEIRTTYPQATVELLPSSGGRFEVTCDGVPIFQKSVVRRHAHPGEVVKLLASVDTPS
ncbi:MAG: Rdx family protein [Gemmatimonadetes bacterium]|nr:Rdx family protein [Gemmatimonadota bacterium]